MPRTTVAIAPAPTLTLLAAATAGAVGASGHLDDFAAVMTARRTELDPPADKTAKKTLKSLLKGLKLLDHLRFFTRRGLDRLVAGAGSRVEREAVTTNTDAGGDLAFAGLAALYRRPAARGFLLALERRLAVGLPRLFGYQFVLRVAPVCTDP